MIYWQTYKNHHLMLMDKIRVNAFQKAIFSKVKKGDIVVDIGTGTGILAFFALKAGAKKVYAVENTNTISIAQRLAHENGFSDRIEFMKGISKDVQIPERADLVMSETIGHLGCDEDIVRYFADARNRFLKPNGRIIPCWIRAYLVPVECRQLWNAHVGCWGGRPYELGFDTVRDYICKNRIITSGWNNMQQLGKPSALLKADLNRDVSIPLEYTGQIAINKKGIFHGLVGFFVAGLTEKIAISTSLVLKSNSWQYNFFPHGQQIFVRPGDLIQYSLKMKPKPLGKQWQWIMKNVSIVRRNSDYKYDVDVNTYDSTIDRLRDHKPCLDKYDKIQIRCLNLCTGKKSIDDIVRQLMKEYPKECYDYTAVFRRVANFLDF